MTAVSVDYRRTQIIKPTKVTSGLDAVLDSALGMLMRRKRFAEHFEEEALRLSEEAEALRDTSERKLKDALIDVARAFRRQGSGQDKLAHRALPLLVEAAHRTLGLRPYPVQVMAALAAPPNQP